MRNIIINEVLIPALRKLYETDYDNIRFGVSERNICARLSLHMENIMREYDRTYGGLFIGYYAEVEYNRMGNGDLKHYENSIHLPQYMVSDLLIMNREGKPNLLAVEMKRKGNCRGVNKDRDRLKSLVSSQFEDLELCCVHDTLVGAFIMYSSKEVRIELFENIGGQGEKTLEIHLIYEQLEDKRGTLNVVSTSI